MAGKVEKKPLSRQEHDELGQELRSMRKRLRQIRRRLREAYGASGRPAGRADTACQRFDALLQVLDEAWMKEHASGGRLSAMSVKLRSFLIFPKRISRKTP